MAKPPESAVRIVVGLWPQGETALSDAAIQSRLVADRYVSSLADAVAQIAADPNTAAKAA